jgi:Tfp pilus assembly protein PilO
MDKRFFAIPILIFSAFLILIYLVVPQYKKFLVLQRDISQLRSDINDKNSYYAGLKDLLNEIQEYKPVLEKVDSAIPPSMFAPELLSYFQTISSDNGLLLSSIIIGKEPLLEEGSVRVKATHLNLGLMGSLASLENFLRTIERSVKVFEVETLSFSANPDQPDMTTFNLSIKTFSY